jgi:hypothetical protein
LRRDQPLSERVEPLDPKESRVRIQQQQQRQHQERRQQQRRDRPSRMRDPRWRVWRDSVKTEVEFQPIPSRDVWDWLEALEERERQTKKPGRQDGEVGRNGLAVARAMRSIINWTTGQLTPSWRMIATAANIGLSSVYRGLKALKACGALEWQRRCLPDVANGDFCLTQISSAYFIQAKSFVNAAECPEPLPEELGLEASPPPDAAETEAEAHAGLATAGRAEGEGWDARAAALKNGSDPQCVGNNLANWARVRAAEAARLAAAAGLWITPAYARKP